MSRLYRITYMKAASRKKGRHPEKHLIYRMSINQRHGNRNILLNLITGVKCPAALTRLCEPGENYYRRCCFGFFVVRSARLSVKFSGNVFSPLVSFEQRRFIPSVERNLARTQVNVLKEADCLYRNNSDRALNLSQRSSTMEFLHMARTRAPR